MRIAKTLIYTVIVSMVISVGYTHSPDNQSNILTKEEQEEAVKLHNKYRNEVGVAEVKWSSELQAAAQKWANHLVSKGCNIAHSSTDNGENIYWHSNSATPVEAIENWYTEKELYDGKPIDYKKVSRYGHYTQMVWHSTTHIGIARAYCKNGGVVYVCHYAPAGNVIGQMPYKKK